MTEPYVTKSQLAGRIHFIKWVNPSRGERLLRQARSIDWKLAMENAKSQGLVEAKKRLIPKEKGFIRI